MSRQYEDAVLRQFKKDTDEMFAESDRLSASIRTNLRKINTVMREHNIFVEGIITQIEGL